MAGNDVTRITNLSEIGLVFRRCMHRRETDFEHNSAENQQLGHGIPDAFEPDCFARGMDCVCNAL
jgi:hypothetical protein